jgi:methionyl aminopeptidase
MGAATLADLTGFPSVLCASRNNVAVHGMPDETPLAEGDIVSLDLSARMGEWCADVAWTFVIGPARATTDARRVRNAAFDACRTGVAHCVPNARVGDVAAAMSNAAAAWGCQVVPDFAGHGIGKELHEAPSLSPRGLPGMGELLVPGLVVTVEPVVVLGGTEVDVLPDGWTYVTGDGSLAAQFEVMVHIGPDGPEIISYPPRLGHFPDSPEELDGHGDRAGAHRDRAGGHKDLDRASGSP